MTALKQSYVNGASEQPLIGETIGRFFDDVCAKWASRPALIVRHQKVRLSYGELRHESLQPFRQSNPLPARNAGGSMPGRLATR